jgi:hypothetical protein
MARPSRSSSRDVAGAVASWAALACGALAACSAPSGIDSTGLDHVPGLCPVAGGGMPNANLGPDLSLRVLCGQSASGGIASVNEEGPGATSWTVTLAGDPEIKVEQSLLLACRADGTSVAVVTLQAPQTALPGKTYDAVATIRATGDAFPPGTVKIHSEVVTPSVTVASTLDFGDVPAWTHASLPLRFVDEDTSPVVYTPDFGPASPFEAGAITPKTPGMSPVTTVLIDLMPSPPGDYSVDSTWTVWPTPNLGFTDACDSKKTITLRAHVFDPDGGAEDCPPGGADGGFDG